MAYNLPAPHSKRVRSFCLPGHVVPAERIFCPRGLMSRLHQSLCFPLPTWGLIDISFSIANPFLFCKNSFLFFVFCLSPEKLARTGRGNCIYKDNSLLILYKNCAVSASDAAICFLFLTQAVKLCMRIGSVTMFSPFFIEMQKRAIMKKSIIDGARISRTTLQKRSENHKQTGELLSIGSESPVFVKRKALRLARRGRCSRRHHQTYFLVIFQWQYDYAKNQAEVIDYENGLAKSNRHVLLSRESAVAIRR